MLGFRGSLDSYSLSSFRLLKLTAHYSFLITDNSSSYICQLILSLGREFAIKDLGRLHYFLGIEAHTQSNSLLLSQKKYILDLLLGMLQSKPVCTPMSIATNLTLSKGTPMADPTLYQMVVGSLQYLTLTRPGISFAVCQFMHSPAKDHWQTVK